MKTKIIFLSLFILFTLSCQDTKMGDVDLDFDASIEAKEIKTYMGKPTRIGVNVKIIDEQNNYPFRTSINYKDGIIEIDGKSIKSGESFSFDYKQKGTLYFDFTPDKSGEQNIEIVIENQLVTRTVSCDLTYNRPLYAIEVRDTPERPLIDTKFDFSLFIKEFESTGMDSIVAYAKVIKGTGTVFAGQDIINIPLNEGENSDNRTPKTGIRSTRFAIGKNSLSYQSEKEGENVIRFYITNKWGHEICQDVSMQVNLPEWNLRNSESGKVVDVPFQDNYSFTLNLEETDIFKDNSYEGFYRVLSNTTLVLKINDKEYRQGMEMPLKAGGNVGVINVKAAGEGSIEFIVKDKYKQQHKDTLVFASKLPIKPIEASLDKSSLSVKTNQTASFKLTLAETNYSDVFAVKYDILSGKGSFEGGVNQSFSEGTHSIKYTPTTAGTHTFKITITDINQQEKVLNATVQATLSPLSANLNLTSLNLIQGEKGEVLLFVSESDYTGKFYLSFESSDNIGNVSINGVPAGAGTKATLFGVNDKITFSSERPGITNLKFSITDEYLQVKIVNIKITVQSLVVVTASTGGTVSGGGKFNGGQQCSLRAVATIGFKFLGWYKGSSQVSTNATYSFAVTENVMLEARFTANSYMITATAETGGSVLGAGNFNHGANCLLKATVNTSYTFNGWYDGATKVSTALDYTFAVTANRALVAKFTANKYNVSVNAQTGGTVSGAGSFEHNSAVTVKAVAKIGYTFNGWYNGTNKVSDALNYTFTLTGAITLEARFSIQSYAVVVNAETGGTATGSGNFNYGENVIVKALATEHYDFVGWYEGATKVSASATYNFSISKAITLLAKFTLKKYTLTVSAGTGGTVIGGGSFDYNSNATLTATVGTGYAFDGWYEASTKLSGNLSYIAKVTSNRSIEAKFVANKFNVTVNAETGGTATGSGAFSFGSSCTVTATVTVNYKFDGWYEGATKVSTSLSYTFTVSKAVTLVAKFIVNKHTISVSGVNGTQTGGGAYDWGSNATLKATPVTNYIFIGWYEGSTKLSDSSPYTFKVDKDKIIEAKYEKVTYTITLTNLAGGSVTGGGVFTHGQLAALKATPNIGHTFAGWYKGASQVSTNANYSFSVTENVTLEARFTANSYMITATADTGGSVSGAGNFNHGDNCSLKASVNTGYTFNGWYDGTTKVSTALDYTFSVTASRTLVAKFTANKYNVTVNAQTGGTVSGSGSFEHNSAVTVRAVAKTGYNFAGWYNGTNKVSDALDYTFTLTGAITLEARFSAQSYAVVVNAETGGTATGSGNFNYGENVIVKALATEHYDFAGWYEGATKVSASATYNFSLSKAITLLAKFTVKKYTLTVSASTGGTVSGGGSFDYNSNATLTATVGTGYAFDGWYEGSTKLSGNLSYIAKVTTNRSIEARFIANKFNVTVNAETGGTATGSGSFSFGSSCTVVSIVTANYKFDGWHEGATKVSTSLSYTFTVSKAVTLVAKFTVNKHTITVSGVNGTQTGGGSYDWGSNVILKATSLTDYKFVGWYEGSTKLSDSNPYTFKVDKDRIIEAKYEKVTYTVSLINPVGGSVTGGGTFTANQSCTLKAIATTGYNFLGWYKGASLISNLATYVFNVTESVSLEARFSANSYMITATAETGGSVSGAGNFNHGSNCLLKATVNTGYTFNGWYDGATRVSTALDYTFAVTANRTLVAKFTANKYNVTVNAQAGGTVSGAGSFEHNSAITVKAVAKTGYNFTGWYNGTNKVSDALYYTFTLTATIALEARFSAQSYAVVVNAETGGTATGSGNFNYGDNVIVKALATEHYDFVGWYEGTNKVSASATYNFSISKAVTLIAKFTVKKYTLTVSAGTGGTVTGGGSFDYNSNATLTATVGTGFAFDGWYEGSTKLSGNLSYIAKVTTNRSIEAKFIANKFNVTVNAEAGGTATGSGAFSFGTNATIVASVTANYKFDGWYEGATKVSTSLSYTFTVSKAVTLVAKFIVNKHTISVSGVNGTQTGGGAYDWGSNATLKATPVTNYIFIGWYEGSTKLSDSNPYTFKVDKDKIIEAKYDIVKRNVTVTAGTGGTVIGGGSFSHNSSVTVNATADANYTFEGWYNGTNKVSTSATYTFNVTTDISLVAKFTANKFNVTANAQTGGTATGSGSYDFNSSTTVVATVTANYTFDGWYEGTNKVSTSLSYSFTVTKNITLEARFIPKKFNVTANAQTGGTATGSGSFNYDSNVTVIATVGAGYALDGWYNGTTKVSASASYTFVLKGTTTLEARFIPNKFTIITNAGTGGTASGAGKFDFGSNATVVASVIANYAFDGWYEGSTKVATTLSYTFKIDKDRTLEARFTPNKYNVVVNAETGGTATGSGSYAFGTNCTVSASASSNYKFDGWYEGATKISTNLIYTFTVSKVVTLVARFIVNKHSITVSGVNGAQTGGDAYNWGSNATLKATPNTNYEFIGWYEGANQLSTSNPYTFKVEKDRIIEAKYKYITYSVTTISSSGGTALGGGMNIPHASNTTVTATPNTGYNFEGWYNGTNKVSSASIYVFSVTSTLTLTAKFTIRADKENYIYQHSDFNTTYDRYGSWNKYMQVGTKQTFSIKEKGTSNFYDVLILPSSPNPMLGFTWSKQSISNKELSITFEALRVGVYTISVGAVSSTIKVVQ